VRQALVCGFFMQVAHKEGTKYVTVKDGQTVSLHPSCGIRCQPEWVMFNEFVLTKRPYIRTVTVVQPEWLLTGAANYYDLEDWKDSTTRRALVKVHNLLGSLGGRCIGIFLVRHEDLVQAQDPKILHKHCTILHLFYIAMMCP